MRTLLLIAGGWSVVILIIYMLLGPGQGLPSWAIFVS
jgi:hypothetical protein